MNALRGLLQTDPGARWQPLAWVTGWWRMVRFGALMAVMAFGRETWDREGRQAVARHVYADTVPILAGFTAMCALLTVVITRIVIVTARSYGLSHYALEMVIRVLVLELIPLTAALFVALRCTIPNGATLAWQCRSGRFAALREAGVEPLRREALPRVLGGLHATFTLAALSCTVAIVLAYLAVHGASTAGLQDFTRVFGQVFNPSVTLIFCLKTLFFALAVSVIPMASAVQDFVVRGSRESAALLGLVRMFAVLLCIEMASLAGNYY